MVKMKYYNGCSLIDFLVFHYRPKYRNLWLKQDSENIDPRTERRPLDGGSAHPSDQKSLVTERAFSKTEITTT